MKSSIAFYLEDVETPVGRVINLIFAGLVLLSSTIFVVQTYTVTSAVRLQLNAVDTTISVIFVFEYLLRLWCAESKIKYFFSFYSIIDLIAICQYSLE